MSSEASQSSQSKKLENDLFCEKLISAVFPKKGIWNKSSPEHKYSSIYWQEVAQELNANVDLCKSKWKSLMDAFRSNLRQVKTSKSGDGLGDIQDKLEAVKWKFFKQMLFVKDSIGNRKTSGNYHTQEDSNVTSESILNADDEFTFETDTPNGSLYAPSPLPQTFSIPSPPSQNNSSLDEHQVKKNYVRKSTGATHSQTITNLEKHLDELTKEMKNETTKSSRFADYLADLHEQIPESKRRKFETDVINVANAYIDWNQVTIIVKDNSKSLDYLNL